MNTMQLPEPVKLKTLCTGCLHPMVFVCPPEVNHEGKLITASDYLAQILMSDEQGVYCEVCLEGFLVEDAEIAAAVTTSPVLYDADWCQWK